jgi:hypothetical protein
LFFDVFPRQTDEPWKMNFAGLAIECFGNRSIDNQNRIQTSKSDDFLAKTGVLRHHPTLKNARLGGGTYLHQRLWCIYKIVYICLFAPLGGVGGAIKKGYIKTK